MPYVAVEIVGDHDGLLEARETAELRVAVSGIDDGAVLIGPSDAWTLQVSAPFGGIVRGLADPCPLRWSASTPCTEPRAGSISIGCESGLPSL